MSKDGLSWWGMQTGQQSVITLWDQGFIRPSQDGRLAAYGETAWEYATQANIQALSTKQKLTVNHVKDKAGVRGNSVHKALEKWVEDQTIPVPEFYPEEEQGYVKGLVAFLTDLGPLKSKPQSEIMVASAIHRVAGRYDLEAVLDKVSLVTKRATPSWTGAATDHHSAKGPEKEEFSGRTLFDLKTSKGIYLSHKIQMAGYEVARLECGMPATKQQIVIQVASDGTYVAGESDITPEEFEVCLRMARITAEKGKR